MKMAVSIPTVIAKIILVVCNNCKKMKEIMKKMDETTNRYSPRALK